MFASTKALLVIVSCALVAQAQSPSDTTATGTMTATAPATQTSGVDACILNCVEQALPTGGCTSVTDLTCLCNSAPFQQAAEQCLMANCPPADQQTAQALQQAQCAGLTSTAASTPASSAAHTPTSATSAMPSATTSSAAMALSVPLSFGGIVGTFFASAGALVGAAFVL